MKELPGNHRQSSPEDERSALRIIQSKFNDFVALLDGNNSVLKEVSDLEDKSRTGEGLDIFYVREKLALIHAGVRAIIDRMVAVGGAKYAPLYDRLSEIESGLGKYLPGLQKVEPDDYTIPFDRLTRERVWSVGSKNAQLGEMKARLRLQVPDGFAISAWAYRRFVEANRLQSKFTELMSSANMRSYEDLVRVSDEIRTLVSASSVPAEIAGAIRGSLADLKRRSSAERFSMRSSAIGEDTLFSFAGQYASYLNVRGRELVDRYRDVLASKFTPQAIFYLLSHSLNEADLAMSVGCVAMIDAAASGVAYTRDPVRPSDRCVLVNSIYGLGRYLVDGTLTPDVFRVSRDDKSIQGMEIADKPIRLVPREEGGTTDEPVPASERRQPSISSELLLELTEIAIQLEQHYGFPQDVEWAIDKRGKLYVLQTRPLQVLHGEPDILKAVPSSREAFLCGGTTVFPGAATGPVFKVSSARDLPNVPEGSVLVAQHPFPGLVTVMKRVSALVTEVGGVVNHAATLAREYRLPSISGIPCLDRLSDGAVVTVDASAGTIYSGALSDLVNARRADSSPQADLAIHQILREVLSKIAPLNLVNPADSGFIIENCATFHDITRFTHQKAVEEMFAAAEGLKGKDRIGVRLDSEIPLDMSIIFMDESYGKYAGRDSVAEDEIPSGPMLAFWKGVRLEGWPASAPPIGRRRIFGTTAEGFNRDKTAEYSQSSFAILSREYAIVGLHMGYHFTTVEAICSQDLNRNFIRMQYKEGGSSLDRRVRRVRLISSILSAVGFDCESAGDFFKASISHLGQDEVIDRLFMLGRLAIMTKQLDMALHNDQIAEWYTQEFMKKLINGGSA